MRNCPVCGGPVLGRADKVYCSRRCLNVVIHRRNAPRSRTPEQRRRYYETDYARHAEAKKARARAYDVAHPEEKRARHAAWRASHPEAMHLIRQVNHANKVAKRLGVVGRIAVRDVEHLPFECVYCGSTENLTLDHATPMSRGGANDWANLTVACGSCNSAKNNRTVAEFWAWRRGRVA